MAALHLEIHHPLSGLPGLLEDCLLRRPRLENWNGDPHLTIGDLAGVAIHSNGDFDEASVDPDDPPIDRHQLVLARVAYPADPTHAIHWLVEHVDHPVRPEAVALSYPPALNRLHSTAAVVGPLLSVLCNHPPQIESAAILSAALAVGSAANLREIRTALRHHVRGIPGPDPAGRYPRTRRRARREYAIDLARLALDLSEAVEAPVDRGGVARSPEVLAYHRALRAAVGLSSRAAAVEQHLRQLDATVRARIAPARDTRKPDRLPPEPGWLWRWLRDARNPVPAAATDRLHQYSSEHRDM